MVEAVTAQPPHTVRRPAIRMGWRDVVFVHWPCSPDVVRTAMPPRTEPDLADGRAWIGVVGIRITWLRAATFPALPYLGPTELNVRTYSVDDRGRRGLVFLTMEASHPVVVHAGRLIGGLPYRLATVDHAGTGPDVAYRTDRYWPGPSGVGMRLRIEPGDQVRPTAADHFLTARWRLHTRWHGATLETPVDYAPWTLHTARLLDFDDRGLLDDVGLPPPDGTPSVLYSPGVDAGFGVPTMLVGRRPVRFVRSRPPPGTTRPGGVA